MPDIHWHIGEDAEQETIATTTSSRRSRRSWVVILMVVVIGAVLGAVYRTIPEPAPWPTPLPAPTPQPTPMRPAIPAKLYEVIDREAQALADGDVDIYLALHAFQDPQTIAWLRSNFAAWSRQTDDRPLYAIIDFNLRPQTKAWADIRQFRKGRWFREMRFYRWYEDRWLRSDPDALYWSGQTGTLDTAHFHVIYFVEDQEFIQPITDQLKKVQGSLCAALGCDATPLTYTLKLDSSIAYDWPFFDDEREIRFVSPRIFGVYEDDTPLDEEGGLNWIWMMAWTSAYHLAHGQAPASVGERASDALLWAISYWATLRAVEQPEIELLAELKARLTTQPLPLETLWSIPTESYNPAVYDLAYATIYFIEQEYGAQSIPKLLKVLGTAQSLAEVIENGLGVPFAEFDQKWQAWLNADTQL
ncbi:MAG: hypothetical protein HGB05_11840 [Chloroflexi bacterium]|nr:hypothetical protein [Chloroflexota bacterium]